MARTALKEVQKAIGYLESLGFGVLLSRPDREYRLHIWPERHIRDLWPREIHFAGSLAQCYEVMKAVIMGFVVGRAVGK